MTLSEIEITLDELVARHQNLNSDLLSTLLLSAGWEDKNIKDAVALFKQRKPKQPVVSVVIPSGQATQPEAMVTPTEITFYQPDGSEEKKLQGFVESPTVPREEIKTVTLVETKDTRIPTAVPAEEPQKNQVVEVKDEIIQKVVEGSQKNDEPSLRSDYDTNQIGNSTDTVEDISSTVEAIDEPVLLDISKRPENITIENIAIGDVPKPVEPQSLIPTNKSTTPNTLKQSAIPEDLPIVPFESSPHIWSFSRYKDTFHGEVMPEKNPTIQNDTEQIHVDPVPTKQVTVPVVEDVEIDLEKTPMTKGDESLVFLAGVMLLVIILILGYMYSNGRL